tara:strand:+ start:66 stop:251 length:186 start_codon:yes stop_codon:yes gene_type:complete
MRTINNYLSLLILLVLISCGNYKDNILQEGVIDKSLLSYPPKLEESDSTLEKKKEILEENN